MSQLALPQARNIERSNRPNFFRCATLVFLACSLPLLSACSVGNSAVPPASQSSTVQNLAISGVLPHAAISVRYNATLTVSGGTAPYYFAVTSGELPSGLVLGATTGTISGAPRQTGSFSFSVSAKDRNSQSGSQSFQVTVTNTVSEAVAVTPATATVPSAGTAQFTALVSNTQNVAVTWSASQGTISSTGLYQAPTITASTNATVTATSVGDPGVSGTASVTITASLQAPLSITSTSLSGATAGTSYSDQLSASGGKTPYSWTLTSGTLPPGIALQGAGVISGTTTQTGTFNFTVQVADSSSPRQIAVRCFALNVHGATQSGSALPAHFFGFTETDTAAENFPTVNYGMQRFWDSPPLQWPFLNTASGVFNFTNLDKALAQDYANGVVEDLYTLARTPPWATSAPNDTSCNYTGTILGSGNGECDPPNDLNSDGSGANAIWKAWITAIATHVNSPTYLQTHAHIKYWEIWNEPDTQAFWSGSIAQLARLTEDANCIITGRGVIHESGNGSATPCTATAIDPTAQIVMASGHAKGLALNYAQNQLYCNASPQGYRLPCPNPPNAIASAVDIINFHMKPGNEIGNSCPAPTPCTPETAMQMYVSNIHSILQPAELAKPLWDGEASYSRMGFTGAYTDSDMQASFMPRFYLIDWTLGISGMAWYTWETSWAQPVQTAYQQTYDWLADSTLATPCAATGTVWSCGITRSGTEYLILWDTAQTCSGSSCTTANQTVASKWTQYQDMTTVSAPLAISGNVVPVGIKPIVLN